MRSDVTNVPQPTRSSFLGTAGDLVHTKTVPALAAMKSNRRRFNEY
jgi:hypothetical protein